MRSITLLSSAVTLLWACSGLLEPSDIAGRYVAFGIMTTGSLTGDFLAAGGSLEMTLSDAGTTTGSMLVPASMSESGNQETYDLTGTFTIDENEVIRFDQSADTFIRDGDWLADRGTLRTTIHEGGLHIYAAMRKQ